VFSDDIVDGTIGNADIKDGTVLGADVANGSLTGADIKSGTVLGAHVKDGSLTGADVGIDSLTGAGINESTLVLTCPGRLLLKGDLCYEPVDRDPLSLFGAAKACADDNLHLPSVSEAVAIANAELIWVDTVYYNGTSIVGVLVGSGQRDTSVVNSEAKAFRCVTTVGARLSGDR
jgi:hypothetical protein